MKTNAPLYIAQTLPGFEVLTAEEIESRLEGAQVQDVRRFARKNGLVIFSYDGDPGDLLELRTAEDVFVLVLQLVDLPPVYAALKQIQEAVTRSQTLVAALAAVRRVAPARGGEGRVRFRMVARLEGQTTYRRVDAQQAVERGLVARTDQRWSLATEGGIEIWLSMLPDEALVALRLSDASMRHRKYKIDHMPASLRPSAAAGLIRLTRPHDHDYFLDPMCGAGTVLIERALAGRYKLLRGGDIDEQTLAVARANIGTRYQPIEINEWDATQLPLDAASCTAAAVNLPFGRQIGSVEENRTLYPAVLREIVRVLRPGGRLALLSGDYQSLTGALRRISELEERRAVRVEVLGTGAQIIALTRV